MDEGDSPPEHRARAFAVTSPAEILPARVNVVACQVIVGSFQVTVPGSVTTVTVPEQYYQSLAPGTHDFEMLAIDANGNRTITEGTFVKL